MTPALEVEALSARCTAPELAVFFESPRGARGYGNPWEHTPMPGAGSALRWKLSANEARAKGYRPRELHVASSPLADFDALGAHPTRALWLGHASFLLALDELRVLVDPIFGGAGVGPFRYPRLVAPALMPHTLPPIDAVLITHGHHDHLCSASVAALAQQFPEALFIVPEGLRAALPRACRVRALELSWWQRITLRDVGITLVPAQHWHQRGALDKAQALWGGYVLEGTHRVFHSGDTGFFGGFAAIGEVFGGVDLACLPLGAYEPRWMMRAQHMSPDESLDAFTALRAQHLVGMHWGTFDMADEPPDAGPEVLLQLAQERGLSQDALHVVTPGGIVALTGARGSARAETTHRVAS